MYHAKNLEVGTVVVVDPTVRGSQMNNRHFIDGYIGIIIGIADMVGNTAIIQDVITHHTYCIDTKSLMTVNEFAEWVRGVNAIIEHCEANYYGMDITAARHTIMQIPAAIDINRDLYKAYIYYEKGDIHVSGIDIARSFEIVRYLKIVEIDLDDDDDDDDWDDDSDPIVGLNNEPDESGDE